MHQPDQQSAQTLQYPASSFQLPGQLLVQAVEGHLYTLGGKIVLQCSLHTAVLLRSSLHQNLPPEHNQSCETTVVLWSTTDTVAIKLQSTTAASQLVKTNKADVLTALCYVEPARDADLHRRTPQKLFFVE